MTKLRIAIASSGLGHVWRGIEGWAIETARCLHRVGNDVTLFSAGPLTLSGNTTSSGSEPSVRMIGCLKRDDPWMGRLQCVMPPFTWRWGLKSPYGIEQATFWLNLWRALRSDRFDVLHVQDPLLAYWCIRFNTWGLLKLKVVLAHGTNEDTEFLSSLDYVQSLTPWQDQRMMNELQSISKSNLRLKRHYVIPNFVDCHLFMPGSERTDLVPGLPADAWVVGCVAMVSKDTKRIDYLIEEFARAIHKEGTVSSFAARAHLVIVGARRPDTDELIHLAQARAPGRIHIKVDVPRTSMPAIYRSFDLLVLTSLFEMMPMAVLEGMATGLPIIAHNHPILQWVLGVEHEGLRDSVIAAPCGICADMSVEGVLATVFRDLTEPWLSEHGRGSLNRVKSMFSETVVIQQMEAMYTDVCVG